MLTYLYSDLHTLWLINIDTLLTFHSLVWCTSFYLFFRIVLVLLESSQAKVLLYYDWDLLYSIHGWLMPFQMMSITNGSTAEDSPKHQLLTIATVYNVTRTQSTKTTQDDPNQHAHLEQYCIN